MNTIFLGGVQPRSGFRIGQRFVMGQTLTKADRDHYLVAVNRALSEADEIDAWLLANPLAKLKPTELEMAQGSDLDREILRYARPGARWWLGEYRTNVHGLECRIGMQDGRDRKSVV